MAKEKVQANPEREMTLLGHLDELRTRLIICIGTLLVATTVAFFFAQPVLEFLIKPVTMLAGGAPPKSIEKTPGLVIVDRETGALKFEHPELLESIEKLEGLTILLPATADRRTTKTLTVAFGENPMRNKIFYSRPFDSVLMPLKVAFVMGILFSLVVWVWQIWLFIVPGLTDKEKRVVRPLLMGAVVLFPIGALFAYGMFFFVIRVMQRYALSSVETFYTIQDYLKVMTTTMIMFGFIFELPLVVAVLARVGIVTPEFLRHYRKHIYVGLALAAIIITPTTDPYNMLLALAPLIILFEISVFIAKPMAAMHRRGQEADGEEGATP